MYCRMSVADLFMYSAHIRTTTKTEISEDEYSAEWDERIGRFGNWLLEIVMAKKLYRVLFTSFLLSTLCMLLLMVDAKMVPF